MAESSTSEAEEIEFVFNRFSYRMQANGVPPIEIEFARRAAPTTWVDWYEHWTGRARRFVDLAEQALERDRRRTAAPHFLEAASCYQFSQFMWYGDLDAKNRAIEQSSECFRRAAPLLEPEMQIVYAPREGRDAQPVPICLSVPTGPGPHACVVALPGLESTRAELHGSRQYYLDRSIAFASIEGPGQGELHREELTLPAYVAAVSAVVDLLVARPEIDARRIGIFGNSLGGFLAPLAVASDTRFQAAVESGGPFDLESRWAHRSSLTESGYGYVTKSKDASETFEKLKSWTLKTVVDRINCPFLIAHGELDTIVPIEQAEMFRAQIPRAELLIVPDGNHGCSNLAHIFRPLVADWFVDTLGA